MRTLLIEGAGVAGLQVVSGGTCDVALVISTSFGRASTFWLRRPKPISVDTSEVSSGCVDSQRNGASRLPPTSVLRLLFKALIWSHENVKSRRSSAPLRTVVAGRVTASAFAL